MSDPTPPSSQVTEGEPRCLTHRQPIAVCVRTGVRTGERCSVTAEDYALMEASHVRYHDLMRTPECDYCGRCELPHRECRCYWPEKVEPATNAPERPGV